MRAVGVPFDGGRHPQGRLQPTAVVLHRTYGLRGRDTYRSAYQIGKSGRAGQGIGFHFLIGKNTDQWVQFYDTTTKAAHAKGANSWAIGIEFDGVNEDALTDWQVRAGAWILAQINQAHGISVDHYTTSGPRRRINGCLPHSLVPTSDHTDLVTEADFGRMRSLISSPECHCPDPPAAPVDWAAVRRLVAADIVRSGLGAMPTLSTSSPDRHALYVVLLQKAINLVSGRGLLEDGKYGPATKRAVEDLDRLFGVPADHGVFDATSRFVLTLAVQAIADGRTV